MSYFLGIDIKTVDDDGFQFYQTGFIRKLSEDKGIIVQFVRNILIRTLL